MFRTNRKGFTLIEMLIVIAIIGILASIVLVGIGPVQRQARDSRRASDLRQAQNALELYYSRNSQYPSNAQGQPWGNLQTLLVGGGYVKALPDDPRANANPPVHYQYAADAALTGYVLLASLEDANNPILVSDVDGNVNGLDCNDPSYCVEF